MDFKLCEECSKRHPAANMCEQCHIAYAYSYKRSFVGLIEEFTG